MEYSVLKSADLERLANKVNEAIAEGWRPQGGIAHNGHSLWAQALVKNDVLPDKQ